MKTTNARCDAVLIFDKRRLFEPEAIVGMVEKALISKGFEIVASDEQTPHEVVFQTDELSLTLKCDGCGDDDLMGRLMIAISDISPKLHADTPLVLLAEICRKAILVTEASQIVWLRKDVVFSAQQFLSAFAPVKPRRPSRESARVATRPSPRRVASGRSHQEFAQRLPHISNEAERLDRELREMAGDDMHWTQSFTEDEEAALAEAIRVDEFGRHDEDEVQISRPTRITTWIMTAMLGFFSWPVAAFMVVYNALRGEDFRLSAHTLAVAGAFGVLNASGATAQTLNMLIG